MSPIPFQIQTKDLYWDLVKIIFTQSVILWKTMWKKHRSEVFKNP